VAHLVNLHCEIDIKKNIIMKMRPEKRPRDNATAFGARRQARFRLRFYSDLVSQRCGLISLGMK